MKSKKPSLYDAQEEQIQLQSASFVDFLTRKGVLEDHNIDNERVRKAKKDTAQRAYHNTEVLLSQYRLIIWVLECIPGELSDELEVPVHDIDALAEKIDIQIAHVSFLCWGVPAVFFAAFRKQRGVAQIDPQTFPTAGVSHPRPCRQDYLPPSSDYRQRQKQICPLIQGRAEYP